MTKSRMRRTGSGYQASVVWVTRPGTGTPNRHSEHHAGRSDGSGRRRHVLPREIFDLVGDTRQLPHGKPVGTGSEKSAEVVDLDLEKFFDRVNHDILMSRVARRIGD